MVTHHRSNIDTVGILQPGYLPWLGFFEQLNRCDTFILYDDVQYEKGGWRNRNRIKTPNGYQWLTVPVLLKGKNFPIIKDVQINSSLPWQRKHIKTILQNYSKARYFEQYSEPLLEIIRRKWKYLIDLDIELIEFFKRQLKITTPIILSSDIGISGSNVQRLIEIVKQLQGKKFYEGESGKNYIDPSLFEKEGISVIFQNYEHPIYNQLYGKFISHLSIIDLIFNCGPKSLQILSNT